MVKRIIIDTDPGIDDSMAILFAFCSPEEVEIVGLTTVFGNSNVDQTTENALRLVEFVERPDIPVAKGAEKPLLRPFSDFAKIVHGKNGLGDASFESKPTTKPDRRRAAQFIVDTVMEHPAGEITLVALGPLTNLALAVALEPQIAHLVDQVVLMGGAANARGNASGSAEANIRNDPEAAKMVFDAPWKVVMVGLDVTCQTIMDQSYLDYLMAHQNKCTDFIGQIVPHYVEFNKEYQNLNGFHVHDSSALAYVIDPTLFKTRLVHVHVEMHSPVTFGHTAIDARVKASQGEPNVHVCMEVDSERFLALYKERLGRT